MLSVEGPVSRVLYFSRNLKDSRADRPADLQKRNNSYTVRGSKMDVREYGQRRAGGQNGVG